MYIIVWKANTRDAHIQEDAHGAIETYPTEEAAREAALEVEKNENEHSKSQWYYNFKIYQEC